MTPAITSEMAKLLEQHANSKTERERALVEQELWSKHLSPELRGAFHRRAWVGRVTKQPVNAVEHRSALLAAEPASLPLWERTRSEQMPLTTAYSQLHAAKKLAQAHAGMSLEAAVTKQLEEYDTWPIHHTRSGKPFRKRPLSRLKGRTTTEYVPKVWDQKSDRGFWSELRKHLAGFVQSRFEGSDPVVADKLYREFERDLKVLLEEYQSKLYRHRRSEKRQRRTIALMSFDAVKAACETLGIESPERGVQVDIEQARQKKKKLARVYHPDANGGGNAGTNARYQEAIEAFAVLEEYNQQIVS